MIEKMPKGDRMLMQKKAFCLSEVAHDIDIPRRTLQVEINKYFADLPECYVAECEMAASLRASIFESNPSELTINLGVSRIYPNE